MEKNKIQEIVKDTYGKIAKSKGGCGCCNTFVPDTKEFAKSIGYSEEELMVIPDESNLALSCGNPNALAGLKEGEVVLDLGSGAGFDCFLAAKRVGSKGKVIGVDMTPEMINKAKENTIKNGFKNIEFILGEIENLPVVDNLIDVVISNCVINLSVDKEKVFREIYRVLKPRGRIVLSDIALIKPLPEKLRNSMEAYVGCIGGAILVDEYKKIVENAGIKNVRVNVKRSSICINSKKDKILLENDGGNESLDEYIVSIYIEGKKPYK